MTVESLDHVNIRVADPDATMTFFIDILGMAVSPIRPTWITDTAGRPVIHVGSIDASYPTDEWRPFVGARDSGAVHHVALGCTDYDRVLARLCEHGLAHTTNDVPRATLRQIFVAEPGGVMLELNFRG
ncbi:MAG: VOC family protein [Sphingobium sp.]